MVSEASCKACFKLNLLFTVYLIFSSSKFHNVLWNFKSDDYNEVISLRKTYKSHSSVWLAVCFGTWSCYKKRMSFPNLILSLYLSKSCCINVCINVSLMYTHHSCHFLSDKLDVSNYTANEKSSDYAILPPPPFHALPPSKVVKQHFFFSF